MDSVTQALMYNSHNQIILDSTVSSTNSSNTLIGVTHFNYGNDLIVLQSYYPNGASNSSLDSGWIDSQSDVDSVRFWCPFGRNNTYTFYGYSAFSFNSIPNPLYFNGLFETDWFGTDYLINKYSSVNSYSIFYSGSTPTIAEGGGCTFIVNSAGILTEISCDSSASTNGTTMYFYY